MTRITLITCFIGARREAAGYSVHGYSREKGGQQTQVEFVLDKFQAARLIQELSQMLVDEFRPAYVEPLKGPQQRRFECLVQKGRDLEARRGGIVMNNSGVALNEVPVPPEGLPEKYFQK